MAGKGVAVRWNSGMVTKELIVGLTKRMKLLGDHLQNAHMRALSSPVSKSRKKRRRTTSRGTKGSSYTYADPTSRSRPGQYPKLETGNLRDNTFNDVKVDAAGIVLKFGTTVKYGERLETKMDRKGLRSTMLAHVPDIRKILLTQQFESPLFQFTGRI